MIKIKQTNKKTSFVPVSLMECLMIFISILPLQSCTELAVKTSFICIMDVLLTSSLILPIVAIADFEEQQKY